MGGARGAAGLSVVMPLAWLFGRPGPEGQGSRNRGPNGPGCPGDPERYVAGDIVDPTGRLPLGLMRHGRTDALRRESLDLGEDRVAVGGQRGADHARQPLVTGVTVTRVDKEVSNSAGSSCTTQFAHNANPVFQTQWVLFGGTSNWVEIGTADQCNDYDFMFWGWGQNGAWHLMGTAVNTPGGTATHVFEIFREDIGIAHYWRFKLDGVVKGTLDWNINGTYVEAGLESGDAGAVATQQNYTTLGWFRQSDQKWYLWGGNDGSGVGSAMCGHWAGGAEWHAAQGATC
jgi:hypothetical protein